MAARRASKRAPARTVFQIRDADFRVACGRLLVSADELLDALRKVVLERELKRLRDRIDRLVAEVSRNDDGSLAGHQRCYGLFHKIDGLERQWDAVFAALYGVTPTGEPAPSSAQTQQKSTAGMTAP